MLLFEICILNILNFRFHTNCMLGISFLFESKFNLKKNVSIQSKYLLKLVYFLRCLVIGSVTCHSNAVR